MHIYISGGMINMHLFLYTNIHWVGHCTILTNCLYFSVLAVIIITSIFRKVKHLQYDDALLVRNLVKSIEDFYCHMELVHTAG